MFKIVSIFFVIGKLLASKKIKRQRGNSFDLMCPNCTKKVLLNQVEIFLCPLDILVNITVANLRLINVPIKIDISIQIFFVQKNCSSDFISKSLDPKHTRLTY